MGNFFKCVLVLFSAGILQDRIAKLLLDVEAKWNFKKKKSTTFDSISYSMVRKQGGSSSCS